MRIVNGWIVASFAALPLAGILYLLGRLEGDRMEAAGQGWEMAFYWSPLVFLAIDAVLFVGAVAGGIGLLVGPGSAQRVAAVVAVLACAGSFAVLPWR